VRALQGLLQAIIGVGSPPGSSANDDSASPHPGSADRRAAAAAASRTRSALPVIGLGARAPALSFSIETWPRSAPPYEALIGAITRGEPHAADAVSTMAALEADPALATRHGSIRIQLSAASRGIKRARVTPLHVAAAVDSTAWIAALVAIAGDEIASTEDAMLTRPLSYASWSGSVLATRALLALGADPLERNEDGMTPLHFAAKFGHAACMRLLLSAALERESEPQSARQRQQQPIDIRGAGETDIVSPRTRDQWTPLHFAACLGIPGVPLLTQLLGHGADPAGTVL
jgi:hypothetical protein